MAFSFKYDPGPGVSDVLLRAMVKNEAIARRLKQKMSQFLLSEGVLKVDPQIAIQTFVGANFIKITIDPRSKGFELTPEVNAEDLTDTFNADEYLFGDEIDISGENENLEDTKDELKDIIDEVLLENVPKSKVT